MTAAHRIVTILAAHVVGCSRHMGEGEAGTVRAVRECREAAQPIVTNPGDSIVKTAGDGVLLEFPSIVAAVEMRDASMVHTTHATAAPSGQCEMI